MSESPISTSSPFNILATTPADRVYRNQRQAEYAKQVWYFIACIIALLSCIRAIRFLLSRLTPPTPGLTHKEKKDLEALQPANDHAISIRRLPLALVTAFRIIAFRWTITISSYNLASVAEVTFIFGYMAAIFIWLLVDSKFVTLIFSCVRNRLFISTGPPKLHVAGSSCSPCVCSASSRRRACRQE